MNRTYWTILGRDRDGRIYVAQDDDTDAMLIFTNREAAERHNDREAGCDPEDVFWVAEVDITYNLLLDL